MNKIDIPSKQVISRPFASGDDAVCADIELTSGENINFVDGFPSSYSAPKANGGKFVTRGEINAIGNLASRNEFIRMLGGLNTFNRAFSDAVGGYPEGAVLDVLIGNKLFKAISLVDNNQVDVSSRGADGINWKYLNQDEAEADPGAASYVDVDVGDINFYGNGSSTTSFLVGSFRAPVSGLISVSPLCASPAHSANNNTTYNATYGAITIPFGSNLFIKELGTLGEIPTTFAIPEFSGTDWNLNGFSAFDFPLSRSGYVSIDGVDQTYITPTVRNAFAQRTMFVPVEKDNYYAVCIGVGAKSWSTAEASSVVSLGGTGIVGKILMRIVIS